YAGRYSTHAKRLVSAFRRTGLCASARPAAIEPTAYAAATSEKLPAPRSSVFRTNSGTPAIHVPDEIVTQTPSVTTAVASTNRGRSASKPSRISGRSPAAGGTAGARIP